MPPPAQDFAQAVALLRQGRKQSAAELLRGYVASAPGDHRGWFLLGSLTAELGDPHAALPFLRRALDAAPNQPDYQNNYGAALLLALRAGEAVGAFQSAVQLRPTFPAAWRGLGQALFETRRYSDASAALRRCVAQAPNDAPAWSVLGRALLAGNADYVNARIAFRRALDLDPALTDAHSNLLLLMNYDPAATAAAQCAESVAWARRHAGAIRPLARRPAEPARAPLRLAFVSPDLHDHSIARFLIPLLAQLDRRKFFVALYADRDIEDSVRARLRGLADLWRSTAPLSAAALAQRIADDAIDIAVDLTGHTGRDKTLLALASRPAPLQLAWLGYPATTGLDAIAYRLTDSIADPTNAATGNDAAQRDYVEKLVRLDPCFLCFDPLQPAPLARSDAAAAARPIVFGSFNNVLKLSAPTLDAWAEILRRAPESRLAFKALASDDAATRAHFEARFAERGIAAARLTWLAYAPTTAAHLRGYDRIDVALDTFPYNGTTTTCEALWMGVPVVALRGERHVARVSASVLSAVGCTAWIADSPGEYVECALALAADRPALTMLRQTLRARMQASPLCDAAGFARRFEATLETLWRATAETSARS